VDAPADGAGASAPGQEQAAQGEAGQEAEAGSPVEADLPKQHEERTADLQRVQAEFANYRRRADKERAKLAASGKESLLGDLLSPFDGLERASQHGDLTGAFKSVTYKLVEALEKSVPEPFAAEGEKFAPSVHEAVQHDTSPDVSGPTVT